MTKIFCILLFIAFSVHYAVGQNFTEIVTNVGDNAVPSISWGDFDNDDDLDLLVSGNVYTRIYSNNGSGVFTDINAGLPRLIWAAADWGDYDNDGDLDIVIAGKPNDYTSLTYIYRNDKGVFKDIQAELPGFGRGSAEWGDYDNDGDLDLLLSGEDDNMDATTRIYQNDGGDEFSEADRWLPGVSRGSATWGDYDHDHDLDVLICGRDISGNSIAAIYRNEGNTYADILADLTAIQEGVAIWYDFDATIDLDVLINGNYKSKVYQNTQAGFIDIDAGIFSATYTKTDQGDFDNDGYSDLIMVGSFGSGKVTAIFRYTDGNGFSLYDSAFTRITYGDVKCADFDNDNDLDFIVSGYTDPWAKTTNVFRNNSTIKNTSPAAPVNLNARTEGNSAILSWDRSSDNQTPSGGISYNLRIGTISGGLDIVSPMSNLSTGKRRIVSFGNASSDTCWTIKDLAPGKYFWSVQAIDKGYMASAFANEQYFTIPEPFTDMGVNIDSVFGGYTTWGDYDNDMDLDLLVTGAYEWVVKSGEPKYILAVAKIFRNDANTDFTEILDFPVGLYYSSNAWGDYDNDGDLDVLITGEQLDIAEQIDTTIAVVYQNMGNDHFNPLNLHLRAAYQGSGFWADFDNDGDLDILLSGGNYQYGPLSIIYRNDGNNNFTLTNPGFNESNNCRTTFADMDDDADLDIIHESGISRILVNKGNLQFDAAETSLPRALNGLVSVSDYDNDYDMDLLIAGRDDLVYTRLFNNENENYSQEQHAFRGVTYGSASWGDYDVDGDLDLLLTGESGRKIALIYSNDRDNGLFTETDAGLSGVMVGSASWGDYDNDGDLDIALNGSGDQGGITKIYRNNGNWQNSPPECPGNLNHEIMGFDVLLTWDRCTDGGKAGGVTYNVRIDTIPGMGRFAPVMSDLNTGYRLLPTEGNAGVNNFYLIKNLPFGKYYWSVQAIDNTYKGGSWAVESSFELGNIFVDFECDTVCLGSSTTFSDLSQSREGAILSWHWDFGDGNTSVEQNPTHMFSASGEFIVKLTIVLSTGSYYTTKQVIVKPKPLADFTAELVSEGGEIMAFDNQTDTVGIKVTEWKWNFGDNTEFLGKNPPQHGYLSTGHFTVQLSVTISNGCYDFKSEDIQVCHEMLSKPEVTAYGPNIWYLVCSNDSAHFYMWYYNGDQLLNESSYMHVANQEMGEYQVAISDDDECYVASDMIGIPTTGDMIIESGDKFIIYPNPNNGHFYLNNLISDGNRLSYRLIAMDGNEISNGNIEINNDKIIHLDFHSLKDGIYFIEVLRNDSRIFSGKLVIKK